MDPENVSKRLPFMPRGGGGHTFDTYKHILCTCIYIKCKFNFLPMWKWTLYSSRGDSLWHKNTAEQLQQWVESIDKSRLPGKYKTLIYQHGVLPRILLSLQVYDIPMSRIEAMERLTTKFLRRWLSIPHCFSSVGLYSAKTIFQLPPSSLIEEYKVTKVRNIWRLQTEKMKRCAEPGWI